MEIQKPRGTQDFFGDTFKMRRELENKFVDFYLSKNYQGIETPMFEQKNLFVRSIGDETDIVSKELFVLERKSDEAYALRPEFTAGIVRALIEMGIKGKPLPIKVISLGSCFRYERPQKGRRRQFNQLNVEVIGKKSPEIDAGVIADAVEFLSSIGLKDVDVNINSLGSASTRVEFSKTIKNFLTEKKSELCELCQARLERNPLRVLDCKNPTCQEIIKTAPTIFDALSAEEKAYFELAEKLLKEKGIAVNVDPSLVRGLDYYTGIVFEFNLKNDESRLASIGGGGRYDDLISELGGPETPAIGLGLGFERIVEFLN